MNIFPRAYTERQYRRETGTRAGEATALARNAGALATKAAQERSLQRLQMNMPSLERHGQSLTLPATIPAVNGRRPAEGTRAWVLIGDTWVEDKWTDDGTLIEGGYIEPYWAITTGNLCGRVTRTPESFALEFLGRPVLLSAGVIPVEYTDPAGRTGEELIHLQIERLGGAICERLGFHFPNRLVAPTLEQRVQMEANPLLQAA